MPKAPTSKPQFLKRLDGSKKSFVLPEEELKVLEWWRKEKIYEKIKEKESHDDVPEFRFVDGPPYTTGSIHLGTAWNKILKDIIIRYRRMRGFRVTDTPGYDTHGLPIEVKMEQRLGTNTKKEIIEKHGMDNFINSCKEFALENLRVMNDQFRRLGCEFWNWERPYVTLHESYMEGCWWMIKQAADKGLLYLGNRPLNTCPRCETALAKHEFEYKNRKDTSIYVKFKILGTENQYFVIWTTTPWTLVANMAIMANPEIEYVRAKVHDEEWILAKNLANMFLQAEVGVFPEILETFTGDKLAGMRYVHPLIEEVPIQEQFFKENEKVHSILLTTEYVSATEGTGLVHCAPGFGPEDYEVAHGEHGITPFSPVNEEGRYDSVVKEWAGEYVFDANPKIIEKLKEKGTLIAESEIEHEYAHCWRCKTPLVYRVLDQWYLKTSTLSQKMIEANSKINWVPSFAGDKNFQNWLENLQDWCISRQRFWGIPLPIWTCDNEECDAFVVVGSRAEIEQLSGQSPEDLHRPWIDRITFPCKACGKGTMRRVEDVADVWLDSGCVMWASNEAVYGDDYRFGPKEYKDWKPADFILEGKDQIRGWFNSLMSCGMLASDRPTYKNVVMHGFITYEGEPMHKSRGNVVAPEEAIERRGAETFRLYCVLSMGMGDDLNFYWRDYDDSYKIINTLWNSYYYAMETFRLLDFKPRYPDFETAARNAENIEDRWLFSRTMSMVKETTDYLEGYLMARYAKALKEYVVNDLSKWYLKLVKGRVAEDNDENDRQQALETLFHVLRILDLVMAPILPVISELVHKDFLAGIIPDAKDSIHLESWPRLNEDIIDEELEAGMKKLVKVVETSRMLREEGNLKLKWPCRELVIAGDGAAAMEPFTTILEKEANVKRVSFKKKFDHVGQEERYLHGETEGLDIFIDTLVDEELLAERFYRDFFRQLQFLRKKANLSIGEYIDLHLKINDQDVKSYLERFLPDIKTRGFVKEIIIDDSNGNGTLINQEVYYCPEKSCLATIKEKQVEKALQAKKRVTCSYCGKEHDPGELVSIKINF